METMQRWTFNNKRSSIPRILLTHASSADLLMAAYTLLHFTAAGAQCCGQSELPLVSCIMQAQTLLQFAFAGVQRWCWTAQNVLCAI
jgi:hypothetical protein